MLYPLRFTPLLRRYLWGGRRLESVLGKSLPPGNDYAESWEIVDHGDDQSVVANGPLQGEALAALVRSRGKELLGKHHPQSRFPLLFKFLDAQRKLSVQVHPNDAQAALLDPPDLGKTEAWLILHAEPDAVIFAGLKRGFDREALAREINRGTTELCLHRIEPKSGDCIFIPAGTVHALGEGLVVAEIQQASDTTFRLFDWNRVGADGKPRPLHIEQALDVIDYQTGPIALQTPQSTGTDGASRLVACDKFVLDRRNLAAPQIVGGDDRFHILAVVAGQVDIEGDPSGRPLLCGETALLPAACEQCTVTAAKDAIILDMYLP